MMELEHKNKLSLSLFFFTAGAIPIFSRINALPDFPIIGYFLVGLSILLLVIISWNRGKMTALCLSSALIICIYTSYQTNTISGTLLSYDQHITFKMLIQTLDTGYVERFTDSYRGARKGRYIPGIYLYAAILSIVTSLTPIATIKLLPATVLVTLPWIGSLLSGYYQKYASLLWIAPLLYLPPTAEAKAQLFALPIIGALYFGFIRFESSSWIWMIGIFSASLVISHTLTPVIGLVILAGLIISNKNKFRRDLRKYILVIVLWVLWISFIENRLIIFPISYLATLKLDMYFAGVETGALREPFPQTLLWWIGHSFRSLFFGLLGGVSLVVILLRIRSQRSFPFDIIRHHSIITLLISGIFGFGFTVILNTGGIQRGWIFVTIFASPAVGYIIYKSNIYIDSGIQHKVIIFLIILVGVVFGIITTYIRGVFRGTGSPIFLVLFATAGVGAVIFTATIFSYRMTINKTHKLSISSEKILACGIVILLIGTAAVGIPASVFSTTERIDSRTSPGLPMYHTTDEYAISSFSASYAEGTVSGDRRVFILVEFYRHDYLEDPTCYIRSSCPVSYIIWFDSYQKMWQGADQILVPHQFPNGETRLDRFHSKIYTTGDASLYYNS